MPRVTSRKPASEMMRALDSGIFVTPDGAEHLVRFGMRLRRSHPVVRMAPAVFVSDDLDDAEFALARRAMLDERGIHERD